MTRVQAIRIAALVAQRGDVRRAREIIASHVRPGAAVVIEVNRTVATEHLGGQR